ADGAAPSAPALHRQPFLAVKPIDLLEIHLRPLSLEHPPQTPVTEPSPDRPHLPQPLAQRPVVGSPRPIPIAAHIHPDQPAGPALVQSVDPLRVVHRPPPRRRPQNFPEAISFNAEISRFASASSFFSLRFSSSSDRSRLASDT